MTTPNDVFRVAVAATELGLLCATMRWHPQAEELFWLSLIVLIAAASWLELELRGA